MIETYKLSKAKKVVDDLMSNGLLTEKELDDVSYLLDLCEHPTDTPESDLVYEDKKVFCKNCHAPVTDPEARYCLRCGNHFRRKARDMAFLAYFNSQKISGLEDTSICQFCTLHEKGCDGSLFNEDEESYKRYPTCHFNGILEGFLIEYKLLHSNRFKIII